MSLSKQLLILLSTLFLLISGVNLILSINNTKAYLENEAKSHAQDTATSLGLSLSPYMKNPHDPIIEVMINAIFDMGYYGEIRLTDVNNTDLIKRSNNTQAAGVPEWFIDYLPLIPASAKSEINSGWTIKGTVHVTVNPAYAHSALYQQAKTSLYYASIALMVTMLLLMLVLRITLASLKRIDQLAGKIANGCYETLEPLPWTRETKNVALSMNTMSKKIKDTINGLNNKLAITAEKLLIDELSGLYKKSVFEADIQQLNREHNAGFLLLIKVDSLSELTKFFDNDTIDQLLKAVATLLKKLANQHPDTAKAYRLIGGEFALLCKIDALEQIESSCQRLSTQLAELGKHYGKNDLAHIGASIIYPADTQENILAAAHEAYEQARLIGANSYYIRTDPKIARDISAWKTLFFDCMEKHTYSVSYANPTFSFTDNQLLIEDALPHITDQQGHAVAVAPFISIAEKHPQIVEFEQNIIETALNHIGASELQHAIAINLSTRTIKNAQFINWLQSIFETNPQTAIRLIFSFSAYAISKDKPAYVSFFYNLHQWGGRVMIKRFEPEFMLPEINKQLKPDFVRLSRDISNGINSSHPKQDYVQTIQEMSKLLDVAILAENVIKETDYQILKTIGIVGASR